MNNLELLIVPLASALIAQLAKFFIPSNHSQPSLKNIAAYSGMPSGHTAMMTSLATTAALTQGINSPYFAISCIFAILIIRDAIGLRRYLGQHAHMLNVMVKELKSDDVLEKPYPHVLEKIGHTPIQVLVGGILGICLSLLAHIIFFA